MVAQAKGLGQGATDALARGMEANPYIAVGVALGIGWLLGRLHQPL
jgi:ElaB/YqjD/DUF883 family membrane-anchored ribosome-binding protein